MLPDLFLLGRKCCSDVFCKCCLLRFFVTVEVLLTCTVVFESCVYGGFLLAVYFVLDHVLGTSHFSFYFEVV